MKIFKKQLNKGFTLTETLVATTIFTLSILALFSTISKGISDTNLVRNRIIGAYLAQEGIEYMRNLRDTYVLYDAGGANGGWSTFNTRLTGGCTSANGCYFDDQTLNYADASQPMVDLVINGCGSACPNFYYKSSTGRYSYDSSGTTTPFVRTIRANQPNGNEVEVTVTVSWTYKTTNDSITFSEKLYKWVQ